MKAAAAEHCHLMTQNDSVPLNVNTMTTWQRPIATSLRQIRLAIVPLLDAIQLGGVDLLGVATGTSSLAAETRRRTANSGCAGNGRMHWSESEHAV
jgi:hypothetical protein